MTKELSTYDETVAIEGAPVAVAYVRITPELRDFISKCDSAKVVIGFEYELGSLNFGVAVQDRGKHDNPA
jgi:hypothetical protein